MPALVAAVAWAHTETRLSAGERWWVRERSGLRVGGLEACSADAVAVGGASLTQGPQSILEESLGSRST
jgi:hypothetical protein